MTSLSDLEICYTPAVELARMIREKEISPVEVVNIFQERIEEINPKLNAFCTLTRDTALAVGTDGGGSIRNPSSFTCLKRIISAGLFISEASPQTDELAG